MKDETLITTSVTGEVDASLTVPKDASFDTLYFPPILGQGDEEGRVTIRIRARAIAFEASLYMMREIARRLEVAAGHLVAHMDEEIKRYEERKR